jgi:hypothetical protein
VHCRTITSPSLSAAASMLLFAGGSSSGGSADVQAALLCLLGKPAKDFVHVDMTENMTSLGFAKHFPSDAWPPHNAVRETATKIRSRVKQGEEKPFVYIDLRKWASFCVGYVSSLRTYTSGLLHLSALISYRCN